MSKQIQICDKDKLTIPYNPKEIEMLFADKATEAIHVIAECSANKSSAWFFDANPFEGAKTARTLRATMREVTKLLIQFQTGSLSGKPKQISKDDILKEFLKEKRLK